MEMLLIYWAMSVMSIFRYRAEMNSKIIIKAKNGPLTQYYVGE